MNIQVSAFGKISGKAGGQLSDEQVSMFTLSNANNMEVKILTLGGIIKEITMPDVNNALKHCIQTFDTIDEYMADESYRGAIVGRYANRIGNGCFSLNGTTYHPVSYTHLTLPTIYSV